MKNLIKFLERPKVIIPSVLVLAIIVGALAYVYVGKTPVVTISSDTNSGTSSISSTANSLDLAFPKAGRLSSISAIVGSKIKKGDILASLDASDAMGAVNQTRGALELAKAQYASLNVQYANAKNSQDVIVNNAYRTLLSNGLVAKAQKKDESLITVVDNNQAPQISGTYMCDKEGSYVLEPYPSGADTGYSFNYSGLEGGGAAVGAVTYYTPQPIGNCGLYVQFPVGYNNSSVKWIINIPNTQAAGYVANKNAYDLAVATRDQVLKQLEANLGKNGSNDANVAQATIDSAEGAYEVALANYKNNLIIAPVDGVITFVDSKLKIGQTVVSNKTVITISAE